MQRWIFVVMMEEADPLAWRRAKRQQQRWAEQNEPDYWWEPGDSAPERTRKLFDL
jgi:hypothetical protein